MIPLVPEKGWDPMQKDSGCSLSRLGVYITVFGLAQGVHDKTPLFLTVKISFWFTVEKKNYCESVLKWYLFLLVK